MTTEPTGGTETWRHLLLTHVIRDLRCEDMPLALLDALIALILHAEDKTAIHDMLDKVQLDYRR